MRILPSLFVLFASFGALPAAAQTAAAQVEEVRPDRDPMVIIAAFKAATGGGAWDGINGLYRHDMHGGDTYLTWVDLRRPAMRVESPSIGGRRVEAYNGRDAWWRGGRFGDDAGGGLEVSRGGWDLFQATTNSFIAAQGYFFPDRFPFNARWMREAREGEAVLDVVELAPEGGYVLDYWFDRASGLLVRISSPEEVRPMRIDYADYRQIGPVRVAHQAVMRSGRGGGTDRWQLRRLEFRTIPRRTFEPGTAP